MEKDRAGAGRGEKQPKYTGEELERLCGSYFAQCGEEGKKYTRPGLILHLGISEEIFDAWAGNAGGKYPEASLVLKKAILQMRDDLEQRSDTMSLFRLKQSCYGGYTDRPVEDTGKEIRISVSFGAKGGKAAAEFGK